MIAELLNLRLHEPFEMNLEIVQSVYFQPSSVVCNRSYNRRRGHGECAIPAIPADGVSFFFTNYRYNDIYHEDVDIMDGNGHSFCVIYQSDYYNRGYKMHVENHFGNTRSLYP